MRWTADDILIAFDSTHAAMAAQQLLKPLAPVVIPTPKAITASCGMTLVVVGEAAAKEARTLIMSAPDIAQKCTMYSGDAVGE